VERDGLTAFELMVVALGCLALSALTVVWGGGLLASLLSAPRSVPTLNHAWEAMIRLPSSVAEPAQAWPDPERSGLPGAIAYWVCTAVALVIVLGLGVLAVRVFGKSRVGSSRRKPLGVDARPRFATRWDLKPLLVSSATPGRFIVARFGRSFRFGSGPRQSRLSSLSSACRLGLR